ncbi:MAG: hypothetical protein JNG83_02905 [Opitutaceae bacterium]|nr:hypothetical protein [Opitutaceae bacterium]
MNEGYWKYLRRISKGTKDAVLGMYIPASWWHAEGRRKMVKRLEARGFPWLKGWLFFTLTIDPDKFAGPVEAYEAGKDRIRRVIHELRERGYDIKRYASKLELQENGWPHWHLLVDTRRFIAEDMLQDIWGHGFVDVKRIKPTKWTYLFKYVVKGNEGIPQWVLDYPKRIRVFQTSSGFFSSPSPSREKKEPADDEDCESGQPETLAQKFARWATTATVRARESIRHVKTVRLVRPYRDILIDHVTRAGRVIDWFHIPLTNQQLIQCIQT